MFRLYNINQEECIVKGCKNYGARRNVGKKHVFDVMCPGHMRLRHAISRGADPRAYGEYLQEKSRFAKRHPKHTDYTLPLPSKYIDKTLCCIEGCLNTREVRGMNKNGERTYKTRCVEHRLKKKIYRPKFHGCNISGCNRNTYGQHSLCSYHRYRKAKGLSMDYKPKPRRQSLVRKTCEVDGCDNLQELKDKRNGKSRYKRYCSKHNGRQKTINLTRCSICGWVGPCDKHRIKPGRDGGKYTKDNIVVVCPNCHRLLDRGIDPKTRLFVKKERKVLLG